MRCSTKFEYEFCDKKHCYIPDFSYKGKLIEIKGDNWLSDAGEFTYGDRKTTWPLNEAKHKCALENNVTIGTKMDINFALAYCINKYKSKTWHEQFKKNKVK